MNKKFLCSSPFSWLGNNCVHLCLFLNPSGAVPRLFCLTFPFAEKKVIESSISLKAVYISSVSVWAVALRSVDLSKPLHQDPVDRVIVATAMGLDLPPNGFLKAH